MLLSDLASALGMNLTLDELMAHPTVLELEKLQSAASSAPAVDYSPRPVYPLTNLQIYFAYVMKGNTTANLPFLFRLDESVDLPRLQGAVKSLFDCHPGLKSIIQMDEGAYKNFRDDSREISVPIQRLTDAAWEELRPTLLKPYYYGENEPLYHIGIYQTDSANYLFFDIAHIVGDGMTMNILFEDLNALYLGQPVEKESYTLYEYVLDEKNREAQGTRARDVAYFQDIMKDFRIRKSILNRRDFSYLDHGEDASLRDRFPRLNLHKGDRPSAVTTACPRTCSSSPPSTTASAYSAARRTPSPPASTAEGRTGAGPAWPAPCSSPTCSATRSSPTRRCGICCGEPGSR